MTTRRVGPISCASVRAELWQLALIVVAVLTIVLVFLPLTPAYALEVFLRAGHAVLRGLRVYPSPSSPAVYSGSAFVYPYVAVLPFLPLAAVASTLAITLFFIAGAGAVVSASFLASGRDGLIALVVLGTAFTITGLQLGALSPLLFAGAVFLWRLRDRPVAFGVLAAAVVASKLFLAPLLAWPLLAGRRRAFAWAACSVLVLLAVGAPRRSFVLLALASWAVAQPHGITIRVHASQAIASHGAWLALAITLTVCGYAMRRRLGPADVAG